MSLLNKQFCVLSLAAILGLAFSLPAAGETYTYDDIGRLTGVVYDDGSSIIYTYDNNGNLLLIDHTAVIVNTFNDVPTSNFAFDFIETLAASGITAGCGGDNYCPEDPVTRAQMAVFLVRGIHGSGFNPPPATGNTFLDVGANAFAAAFIEQFFLDGITSGCGGGNYCPNDAVTRAQMAVFLLRAAHGAGFIPPPATGIFADAPLGSFAVDWIEQLAAEGITSGCGGGNYCPNDPVTRAQMAVFLVRTFGL